METTIHRFRATALLAVPAALLLSACGGEGRGGTPADVESASVDGTGKSALEVTPVSDPSQDGSGDAQAKLGTDDEEHDPTKQDKPIKREPPNPRSVPKATDDKLEQKKAELAKKYKQAGLDPDGNPLEGKANPLVQDADPNAKLAVEFGLDKFDFGRAQQGDILEHTFEMAAAGTSPLKIRQASPTCGCTVGKIMVADAAGEMQPYAFGDEIAPGSRITLEAKLNTASKRNQTQVRINVYHNDPTGNTQLALSANIEPFITATPSFLNFGDIAQGAARTQDIIDVRTARGEKVKLHIDESRPIPKPAGLEIELMPVNPDDEGRSSHWQARVTIGAAANEGSLGHQLTLVSDRERPDAHDAHDGHDHDDVDETGLDDRAKKELEQKKLEQQQLGTTYTVHTSIAGRVLGVLSHTPQFLSMGLVRPGQVTPRFVEVLSHDPDFDLSSITATVRGENGAELPWSEYFTTSVKPASRANAVDVELKLTGLPEGAEGSFRGELVIQTGNEAKPEILVRFSGVCRPGVEIKPGGGE
jgi:hypothetical protein